MVFLERTRRALSIPQKRFHLDLKEARLRNPRRKGFLSVCDGVRRTRIVERRELRQPML